MTTLTAKEVVEKITKEAEKNVQDKRIIKVHQIGNTIRQGDIYIHMVSEDHPVGERIKEKQLAPGTNQGSRHILNGDIIIYQGIVLPKHIKNYIPLGPAFSVKSVATITHPEHAHVELPKGSYQITYQIDARTMHRVLD